MSEFNFTDKLHNYNYILLLGLGLHNVYSPDWSRDNLKRVLDESMDYIKDFIANEGNFATHESHHERKIHYFKDKEESLHIRNIFPQIEEKIEHDLSAPDGSEFKKTFEEAVGIIRRRIGTLIKKIAEENPEKEIHTRQIELIAMTKKVSFDDAVFFVDNYTNYTRVGTSIFSMRTDDKIDTAKLMAVLKFVCCSTKIDKKRSEFIPRGIADAAYQIPYYIDRADLADIIEQKLPSEVQGFLRTFYFNPNESLYYWFRPYVLDPDHKDVLDEKLKEYVYHNMGKYWSKISIYTSPYPNLKEFIRDFAVYDIYDTDNYAIPTENSKRLSLSDGPKTNIISINGGKEYWKTERHYYNLQPGEEKDVVRYLLGLMENDAINVYNKMPALQSDNIYDFLYKNGLTDLSYNFVDAFRYPADKITNDLEFCGKTLKQNRDIYSAVNFQLESSIQGFIGYLRNDKHSSLFKSSVISSKLDHILYDIIVLAICQGGVKPHQIQDWIEEMIELDMLRGYSKEDSEKYINVIIDDVFYCNKSLYGDNANTMSAWRHRTETEIAEIKERRRIRIEKAKAEAARKKAEEEKAQREYEKRQAKWDAENKKRIKEREAREEAMEAARRKQARRAKGPSYGAIAAAIIIIAALYMLIRH